MNNRKAKLEKALAFDDEKAAKKAIEGQQIFYNQDTLKFREAAQWENERLAPLHAALIEAVAALEELQLGHSHKSGDEHLRLLGDNYGWCSFCQTKVNFGHGVAEEALSKIDKVLGEM